jgi:hypothetical protein
VTVDPEAVLKGKTGGVPNGVLAVVVLAGLGYAWYRKKQNATAGTGDLTGSGAGTASDGSTLQGQAPSMFLPTGPPTTSASDTPPSQGFQSNVDWTAAAIRWAIANPNGVNPPMNPISAGTALGDYLAGAAMSQSEFNIVNAIITGIGPPPFPPSGNVLITPAPSPVAPPPTPVTASPPPTVSAPAPVPHTYYTVVHNDNLTTIGRKFGLSWQTIYNNNRDKIKNPNLIYPGQVLFIR